MPQCYLDVDIGDRAAYEAELAKYQRANAFLAAVGPQVVDGACDAGLRRKRVVSGRSKQNLCGDRRHRPQYGLPSTVEELDEDQRPMMLVRRMAAFWRHMLN